MVILISSFLRRSSNIFHYFSISLHDVVWKFVILRGDIAAVDKGILGIRCYIALTLAI